MDGLVPNNDAQTNVYIGPAGWSYPDWEGIVYAQGGRKNPHPLTLLSGWMDLVEINVTYYRPIPERFCESWLARTAVNPRFKFTAKVPGSLTHERGERPDGSAAAAFRASLQPLAAADKLGAVLLQFPWSFRRTPENRTYLARLADLLDGLPLCVEMRHRSWTHPDFLEGLRERSIALCNIDQPALKECLGPSAVVTAPFAYVRLHGRNSEHWFQQEAGRDARYDYLYSREELAPWVEKIMAMKEQVNDLYVITNNHYRGQAVVNAMEMQSSLGIFRNAPPESLLHAYPRLKELSEAH